VVHFNQKDKIGMMAVRKKKNLSISSDALIGKRDRLALDSTHSPVKYREKAQVFDLCLKD
jgi:hypothetical protein